MAPSPHTKIKGDTPKMDMRKIMQEGTYQESAVHAAAGTDRMLRVHPSDHQEYRLWVIPAGKGSVTVWDNGNGWCSVESVNMETEEDEQTFWTALARRLVNRPKERLSDGVALGALRIALA